MFARCQARISADVQGFRIQIYRSDCEDIEKAECEASLVFWYSDSVDIAAYKDRWEAVPFVEINTGQANKVLSGSTLRFIKEITRQLARLVG